jgi:hypothetical protein
MTKINDVCPVKKLDTNAGFAKLHEVYTINMENFLDVSIEYSNMKSNYSVLKAPEKMLRSWQIYDDLCHCAKGSRLEIYLLD